MESIGAGWLGSQAGKDGVGAHCGFRTKWCTIMFDRESQQDPSRDLTGTPLGSKQGLKWNRRGSV
eukprot:4334597-Alexandrium_andersonii.AAC.1